MDDLVSLVCIRADHQWATADPDDAGQVRPVGDGLAYCPDASVGPRERHEWRSCDAAPVATAAGLAADLATLESAAF